MKLNFKLFGLIVLIGLVVILLAVFIGGLHTWTIPVLGLVLGIGGGKIYVAFKHASTTKEI